MRQIARDRQPARVGGVSVSRYCQTCERNAGEQAGEYGSSPPRQADRGQERAEDYKTRLPGQIGEQIGVQGAAAEPLPGVRRVG